MKKHKKAPLKRLISGLLAGVLLIPNMMNISAAAEEAEKYPYNLFGRNGITVAANNFCVNGNWHTNKEADIPVNRNFNGLLTTGSDIDKRVKHIYIDQRLYSTYFAENCDYYDEYSYSDTNINIVSISEAINNYYSSLNSESQRYGNFARNLMCQSGYGFTLLFKTDYTISAYKSVFNNTVKGFVNRNLYVAFNGVLLIGDDYTADDIVKFFRDEQTIASTSSAFSDYIFDKIIDFNDVNVLS